MTYMHRILSRHTCRNAIQYFHANRFPATSVCTRLFEVDSELWPVVALSSGVIFTKKELNPSGGIVPNRNRGSHAGGPWTVIGLQGS